LAVYVVSAAIFGRSRYVFGRSRYVFGRSRYVFHALYNNNLHALARMNISNSHIPYPFSLNEKCSSHKKWAEKRSPALPALLKIDIMIEPIELSS